MVEISDKGRESLEQIKERLTYKQAQEINVGDRVYFDPPKGRRNERSLVAWQNDGGLIPDKEYKVSEKRVEGDIITFRLETHHEKEAWSFHGWLSRKR